MRKGTYRKGKIESEEENPFLLSYSDLLAGVLLVFILILSWVMIEHRSSEAELEKVLKKVEEIAKLRTEINEALKQEFGDDFKIVEGKSALQLPEKVLFQSGKFDLFESGKEKLNDVIPRYTKILLGNREFARNVDSIIIEGHTDKSWRLDDSLSEETKDNLRYLKNLRLSQQRAQSVVEYIYHENFENNKSKEIMMPKFPEKEELRELIRAVGRSYYESYGPEDMSRSRRVEIEFRLNDRKALDDILKITKEELGARKAHVAP